MTVMKEFLIYVIYRPNGSLCLLTQSDESKHWALIIKSDNICMKLEASNGVNDYLKSHYVECEFSRYENEDIFLLAHFFGYLSDLDSAVDEHAMKGTKYCVELNNCQHYVARVLAYLESYLPATGRSISFNINVFDLDESKLRKTMGVLARNGNEIQNKRNVKISEAVFRSRVIGCIGASGTGLLGQTLPAAGIWGSLGYTVPLLGVGGTFLVTVVGVAGLAVIGATFLKPQIISALAQIETPTSSVQSAQNKCHRRSKVIE